MGILVSTMKNTTEAHIKTFARQQARIARKYRNAGMRQEALLVEQAAIITVERMRKGEVGL